MVNGLLFVLVHAASVYHDNMMLYEIVQGKDLTKSCRSQKEGLP
jgi:hypothetical protein